MAKNHDKCIIWENDHVQCSMFMDGKIENKV